MTLPVRFLLILVGFILAYLVLVELIKVYFYRKYASPGGPAAGG